MSNGESGYNMSLLMGRKPVSDGNIHQEIARHLDKIVEFAKMK
ncbi:MAG: hypothetical protein ACOYYI_02850 [Chloroflexota bacterium]